MSVGAASGAEGSVAAFTVLLHAASDFEVRVDYATEDGTAIAGEDFDAASGTLTFAPGGKTRTVSVSLTDDVVDEPDETFSIALSSPVDAAVGTASAEGTITDNDDPPSFSVADGAGVEGGSAEFGVTLAGSGSRPATVSYATSDGTAIAVDDYEAASGTLTFAPGESSRTLSVVLVDDAIDEPAETFGVTLSSASNATIDTAAAAGTIADNDGAPQLSIAGARGGEGDVLDFAVTLAGSSDRAATVSYATSDGTAVAGEDYEAVSGALTFAPGESARTLPVALLDDSVHESAETFTVTLSSARNAEVAVDRAVGRIADDDDLPSLSVAGGSGREGAVAEFVVTLTGPSGDSATVDYATADGTAVAGEDYVAASGTLTFAPGGAAARVPVTLVADGTDEPDETFLLRLRSPTNATLSVGDGTGTIVDADDLPALSVAGGEGVEGGRVEFAVTLAGSTGRRVSVAYATADGSALSGIDYGPVRGVLTFAPGETRRTVPVELVNDAADEPEEHFSLELSSPANATLAVRAAAASIIDDDRAHKAATKGRALLFESTTRAGRQGFVRIVNHSAAPGEFLVEGFDDSGMRVGPLTLTIGAGAARHFNSDDFESGNVDKGIPVGVGPPGVGSWRLEFSSELDLEVLSYARTADGFVTSLHDTAPATAGVHRAVFMNPGGNVDQVGRLRLINPGAEDALVTITGTDDAGGVSAEVVVDLPAGAAREWTAADLESGVDAQGALGDGDGKWRLRLSSDRPVVAMSLIESPAHNLTNLSTLPRTAGRAAGSHAVPLFLSASDPQGRQGFVRVANRSAQALDVRVEAFDGTDWEYEPVALAVGAGEVASFNSDDLELGNPDKGLTGGTGAGDGDWWLELSSGGDDGDLGVWAYVRTADGFLTSMHDVAPEADGAHRVVFFNPARNVDQVSVLWLVNPGDAHAQVTITGVDDDAASPGTAVRTTVAAGSSRRLSSADLESGDAEAIDSGALGDGEGKWRLSVESDRPIRVMSLLENPTGHLTNLSTAPGRGAGKDEATGDPPE